MASLQLPGELLEQVVESYPGAAREILPPDGQLVIEWLEGVQAALATGTFMEPEV